MKAYGLPRNLDLIRPDVGDIAHYGLKSSVGGVPGPGGEIRSSFKKSAAKRNTRRIFKKAARRASKSLCSEE